MKAREVMKMLEAEGWKLTRVTGSHHVYKRGLGELISMPIHGMNKELSPGVYAEIAKKAGWK